MRDAKLLLRQAVARGDVEKVKRLCASQVMDVNQASPTNRTALFILFEFWGKEAEVKYYNCILKYLCQNYNLSASWNTASTKPQTMGKTPLDLIVEKNIDMSPAVIELIQKNNPEIARAIEKHLSELKSSRTVNTVRRRKPNNNNGSETINIVRGADVTQVFDQVIKILERDDFYTNRKIEDLNKIEEFLALARTLPGAMYNDGHFVSGRLGLLIADYVSRVSFQIKQLHNSQLSLTKDSIVQYEDGAQEISIQADLVAQIQAIMHFMVSSNTQRSKSQVSSIFNMITAAQSGPDLAAINAVNTLFGKKFAEKYSDKWLIHYDEKTGKTVASLGQFIERGDEGWFEKKLAKASVTAYKFCNVKNKNKLYRLDITDVDEVMGRSVVNTGKSSVNMSPSSNSSGNNPTQSSALFANIPAQEQDVESQVKSAGLSNEK